jgi:putative hydrolase of the HAD superfamily
MTTPVDGIVLDLDDTLLDTTGILVPAADRRAVAAMCAAGLELSEDRALDELLALRKEGTYEDLFARLASEQGAPVACGETGARTWFRYEVPELDLDLRVELALDELAALAPLALFTFGVPATQRLKVERLGIAARFVTLRYVDKERGEDKTQGLAEVLAGTGWAPERVVVVGDSLLGDIAAGLAHGCRTVWVDAGGERSHDVADGVRPWRTVAHVVEVAGLLG